MIACPQSREVFLQKLDTDMADTLGLPSVTEVTRKRWDGSPEYDEMLWRYRVTDLTREAREQEARDAMFRAEVSAPADERPMLPAWLMGGLLFLCAALVSAWVTVAIGRMTQW